jgi:hypothetical protein
MIDAIPLLLAPEGYQISRSVRLRSSATAYLSRSVYSVASAGTQWTLSMWVKRGALSNGDLFSFVSTTGAAQQAGIQFDGNNNIRWWQYAAPSYQFHKITTAVFRDPSAWYHLVFDYDTTLATAADRCQIWVNGIRQTAFSTSVDPSLNLVTYYKTGTLYPYIGAENRNASSALTPFDGYITEVNFIDGQSLDPSSFGETNPVTGVWQPKKYIGTYGTNGFYLNFSDNSNNTAATIGKDFSGNGNNWTPNNISVTAGVTYDSMLDVPTLWGDGGNGRGNYAVLNPLKTTASILSANLVTTNAASAGYYTSYSTMEMTSGKYYWEFSIVDDGVNARYLGFGIADPAIALTGSTTNAFTGTQASNSRGWTQTIRSSISVYVTGLYNNASTINGTTRSTTTGTRTVMVAYDADSGKCWMGYEGTWWSGDPAAGTSQYFTATAPMIPVFNPYNDGSNAAFAPNVNFGQRPFAYTPPSGFLALNTQNLP